YLAMASCTHVQWLTLRQDETNFELQYGNRLHNITKCLPRPFTQYPSVVLFIGNRMKSKALRSLYPQSAISTCRKFGIVNICIDSTTENEEHPVLLAESVPDYAQAKSRGKQTCHEASNYPVPWPGLEIPRRQEFIDHVQARLLSLFTDVICLFAQDYGGLDAVAERLITWATIGPASNLEHPIRPRLLIVANISGNHFASEALRLQLKVLSHPGFSDSFSSLNVVNVLGVSGHTPREHFSAFKQVLKEEIRLQRATRINTHTLFSMVHIAAFFDLALENFARSPPSTFSFIHASRHDFKVSPNFPDHLRSFMRVLAEKKLPGQYAWEFIASTIILDAFPPDMHMFSPSEVFRVLYREACVLGIQEYLDTQQLSANLLQQGLDPTRPHAVQENSDLSIGTSTGGVISLGLSGKNWTPDQCLTFFHKFAKIIFASKAKARFSIWPWMSLWSWISWIMRISGGRYDADILEKVLREAYGATPMFHTAMPSGMKYAVTATTLSDATLCLISNYHIEGKQTSNLGYKHLPPTSDKGEILLWEAARCTTAAPT
ncbi:hypothetical protein V495_08169, partial [Pseudogymnoascus sp. VKM F-4514 (FW-929)]